MSVNPFNAGLSRGLSIFDFKNNFVVSATPITERVFMEFRAEFFNTRFLPPLGNFAAGNFGQVTGANAGRIGQGALRIVS